MNVINTISPIVYNLLVPGAHDPAQEKVNAYYQNTVRSLLDAQISQDVQARVKLRQNLCEALNPPKLVTIAQGYKNLEFTTVMLTCLTVFPLLCFEPVVKLLLALSSMQIVTAIAVYILVLTLEILICRYADTRFNQYDRAYRGLDIYLRREGIVSKIAKKIVQIDESYPVSDEPNLSLVASAEEVVGLP